MGMVAMCYSRLECRNVVKSFDNPASSLAPAVIDRGLYYKDMYCMMEGMGYMLLK
jgi:hypothetical protein